MRDFQVFAQTLQPCPPVTNCSLHKRSRREDDIAKRMPQNAVRPQNGERFRVWFAASAGNLVSLSWSGRVPDASWADRIPCVKTKHCSRISRQMTATAASNRIAHFVYSISITGGESSNVCQYPGSKAAFPWGETRGACQQTCRKPAARKAESWVSTLR
jgi:hypothetical protein